MQQQTTTMLDAALSYLDRGWSVFPCDKDKKSLVSWKDYQGRHPLKEQVEQWWMRWPDAGIGLALGEVSGVIRIDADGAGAVEELERRGGLPPTMEFTTPSGGRGWLLKHVGGFTTDVLWTGTGKPTHKLILATNYEPNVRGMDPAIWSRIKKAPFNVQFSGDRKDPFLEQKLAEEAPGILRWMVDGCLLWQTEGLGEAKAVTEATAAYAQEQNTVLQFIEERCELEVGHKESKSAVTGAYKVWCGLRGVAPVSDKAFGTAIQMLKVTKDTRSYIGLKLLS